MARMGLAEAGAGWCDAGWHDSVLTIALTNNNNRTGVQLDAGVKIGQVIFFEHAEVPDSLSYATQGTYNETSKTTGAKAEANTKKEEEAVTKSEAKEEPVTAQTAIQKAQAKAKARASQQ
jgi:hypothetical protein